jgi:uncharacterized protein YgiM (DUF1202 family)
MQKLMLGSLLSVFLLLACGEDSTDRPRAVTDSSTRNVRGSIPKDTDVKPPAEIPETKPAKKQAQFVYTKMTCNIRKGPGRKYSIIRKANKGERLEYISLGGNWYKLKVTKGKPQEWVHKSVVILPEKSKP